MVDLQKMRGLVPATDQTFKLDAPRMQRRLIEAVVSDRCPLVGKSIREGRFRSEYNAAVIAVARSGKRISARIGDIVLQPGDTLLLEAHQTNLMVYGPGGYRFGDYVRLGAPLDLVFMAVTVLVAPLVYPLHPA